MSHSSRNLYDILGVERDASHHEIKSRYRKLLLQYHPDKQYEQCSGDTAAAFIEIESAWQVLSDPQKRQEYDSKLTEIEIGQSAPVELELELEEMIYDADMQTYTTDCRCGGEYAITEQQLEDGYNIVPCTSCTLQAQVNLLQTK